MKKTVLITGASSGIGYETAILLHHRGYKVYAGARSVDKMTALSDMGLHVHYLDVSDEASILCMYQSIINECGKIDVLINNAGFGLTGPFETTELEKARYQFEVNFFGLARLTQLVLPGMRERKNGSIINISSVAGFFGEALGSWYHASKFAVEGLTESLRRELNHLGIHITLIEPGIILTNWHETAGSSASKPLMEEYKEIGIKRKEILTRLYKPKYATHPTEVARTILKAMEARKPKLRYQVGEGGKELRILYSILNQNSFFSVMDFIVEKIKR